MLPGGDHPSKMASPVVLAEKVAMKIASFSPRPPGRDSAGWLSSAGPEARPLRGWEFLGFLGVSPFSPFV